MGHKVWLNWKCVSRWGTDKLTRRESFNEGKGKFPVSVGNIEEDEEIGGLSVLVCCVVLG